MEGLKVIFSFKKTVMGVNHVVELATDNDEDYLIGVVDETGVTVYPFNKDELEVVFNSIGELLNR